MCLDAGVTLIDTADVYSDGASEGIVGQALQGRRDDVLIATKVRLKMGPGANDAGLSRHHIIAGSSPTTSPRPTAERHGAEGEGGYAQPACAELSLFHERGRPQATESANRRES